jgi:hypothetical protein
MTYGIDQIFAYYQILCGQSPAVRAEKQKPSAIVTPFPRRQGILRSFHDLDRVRELPSYCYHEVRGQLGQTVGLAKDGYKAPLYIELTASTREDVRRDVDTIASWDDLIVVQ